MARQSDEDSEQVDTALQIKAELFNQVHKVMSDKDIPEDISYDTFLQKAQVHPQLYQEMLKLMKSDTSIVLRRQPSERWINYYNPKILQTWGANMDLQFITDPYSCIMYVTSYLTKSVRAMSKLLKKVAEENRDNDLECELRKVGPSFLNNRKVSAQEAAYRMLSLPLKRACRKVIFVNTVPKDKQVSMLKPQNQLQEMDDDGNICTSPLDRYSTRPGELEKISLVEFSATYTTGAKDGPDELSDHIPDVLNDEDNDLNDKRDGSNDRYPAAITLKNGLGHMKK
ncbi:uncharacterized protein LOC106523078 [Austrofundulus limnaeus]|uniref:Uncharacterized protein LOC106523078 n=1 Tax=Austrofundulus limnaeus TaxID=52670 RepID=A0A2I4BVQ3_AUSLI|nr:PREDICTED: uncharacterized protein LOC106523078 [Austrofundulus limnaeus]